jgi:hypothetical protein
MKKFSIFVLALMLVRTIIAPCLFAAEACSPTGPSCKSGICSYFFPWTAAADGVMDLADANITTASAMK